MRERRAKGDIFVPFRSRRVEVGGRPPTLFGVALFGVVVRCARGWLVVTHPVGKYSTAYMTNRSELVRQESRGKSKPSIDVFPIIPSSGFH